MDTQQHYVRIIATGELIPVSRRGAMLFQRAADAGKRPHAQIIVLPAPTPEPQPRRHRYHQSPEYNQRARPRPSRRKARVVAAPVEV